MFKISLVFCVLVLCTATNTFDTNVGTEEPDELEDFNFDAPDDYYIVDEADMMELNRMNEMVNDMPSLEPPKDNLFALKEQKVKSTVLKAFTNRSLKQKFSEILPILKVMTSSQKLALAALISAQISAQNGAELNLKQVKEMFGNRPDLILPLTLDIANLVKSAGENKPLLEREIVPNIQLLRRSYSSDDDIPSTSFDRRAKSRKLRDVSNQIKIRKGIRVQNHPSMEKLPQPSALASHERSYHERKLNMTAFLGAEDQLAMPSQQSYQIVKPDERLTSDQDLAQTLYSYIKENLTLEEIEKLSFSQLNGTAHAEGSTGHDADFDDEEDYDQHENFDQNNSRDDDQEKPQAEKLISILVRNGGPMQTKSKPIYRKRRPILPANGLSTGMEMKNCEKFANVCLRTPEYPMEQIMGSIRRNQHAMTALLAEYRDKFAETHLDANLVFLKRRNDEVQQPGGMCPTIVRYARPQKARSATGEVKYIVNTGQHSQTLRLEKCTSPQESCTYLTDSYRSRCVQIFNYHRLLSWDKVRGLHVDIFKVPTCCSCHVDGYRETYPPFFGKPSSSSIALTKSPITAFEHHEYKPEFKPSITLHKEPIKYSFPSLTQNDDDDDESDEEVENYRPSYSSGAFSKYTPLKTNYNFDTSFLDSDSLKYTPVESAASNIKIQKHGNTPFIPTSPSLESFLSAPTQDYANLVSSGSTKYRDRFIQRGPTSGLQSGFTTLVKHKRHPLLHRDQLLDETESNQQKVPFENYEITTIRPKRIQIVRTLGTTTPAPTTRRSTTMRTTTTTTTTIRPSTIRFRPRLTTIATASKPPNRYQLDYNNKRINYNYHPIIDFFEEGEFDDNIDDDPTDYNRNQPNFNDRIDRIGTLIRYDRNKWRPVMNTNRRLRI